MLSKIKIAMFDLDNTLYYQTKEMFEDINTFIIDKASVILGKDKDQVKKDYFIHYAQLQSARRSLIAMGIEDGKDLVQEALEQVDISHHLTKDEQLISTFKRFNDKYTTILVTGSAKQSAEKKLNALGLSKYFSEKYYADFDKKRETGEFFSYIMSKHNVHPSQIVMVGDREKIDIIPAYKKGVKTVCVHKNSTFANINIQTIKEIGNYF